MSDSYVPPTAERLYELAEELSLLGRQDGPFATRSTTALAETRVPAASFSFLRPTVGRGGMPTSDRVGSTRR